MHYFIALFILVIPILMVTGQAPTPLQAPTDRSKDPSPCVRAFSQMQPTYEAIRECYRSIPYNKTLADQTVNAISSYMSLNVFGSLSSHPPDTSFAIPFDITATLDAHRSSARTFASDFDFQTSISGSLVAGNDGHMGYIPGCYGAFTFSQPLIPVALWDGTRHRFMVGAVTDPSSNYTSMVGAEIISIQGVPALKYFTDFANKYIGVSKDPLTRLTMAMGYPSQSPGDPSLGFNPGRWAGRRTLPETPEIQYELMPNITASLKAVGGNASRLPANLQPYASIHSRGKQPPLQTLRIPWITSLATESPNTTPITMGITSTQRYWNIYCAPSNYKSMSTHSGNNNKDSNAQGTWFYDEFAVSSGICEKAFLPTVPSKDISSIMENVGLQDSMDKDMVDNSVTSTSSNAESGSSSSSFGKTNVTPYGMAFTILEGGVGVIQISSMIRIDLNWAKAFVQGAQSFEKAGVRKWIVDLSNNSGGVICTSQTLLSLLLRSSRQGGVFPSTWNYYLSTIRSSPLMRQFHDALAAKGLTGPFSPARYGDPRSGKTFTESSGWLNPGLHLPTTPTGPQGDPSITYTLPGASKCVMRNTKAAKQIQQMLANAPVPKAASDLVVLSNGYCGSACANLAEQLADHGVQTVLASAFFANQEGVKGTFSTFPGGEAISMTDMAYIADRVGNLNLLPSSLPVQGTIGFSVRAVLSKDNIALEYRRRPADKTLPLGMGNVVNIHARWTDVARMMGWVN
ncbi:MAG: hypothetical protein DHS80DRAFT_21819 [Piptocephalis tieghemiana]|nr:MAG: hypothetical protein DHS80DRAFT_21819 [Piptocephalis tieghemiana]